MFMTKIGANHSLIISNMGHFQVTLLNDASFSDAFHHTFSRQVYYTGVPLAMSCPFDASLEKSLIKPLMRFILECAVDIKVGQRCIIASNSWDVIGQE